MSKEKKFEENLADLEVIVQKLENGDVPLEEAISEFQKGMQLSKELQATLDKAEKHWSRLCRLTAQKRKWNETRRKIG